MSFATGFVLTYTVAQKCGISCSIINSITEKYSAIQTLNVSFKFEVVLAPKDEE